MKGSLNKSSSPFKFNYSWLKDESFHNLVFETSILYNLVGQVPVVVHFVKNLKRMKKATIWWSNLKTRQRKEVELKTVAKELKRLESPKGGGLFESRIKTKDHTS